MHAPKTKSITVPTPPDELFEVLLDTVRDGKFDLLEADADARRASFTSGRTALSWGQQYVGVVEPASDGSSLEVVAGGLDDAPKALMDGWKNGKAADKVVQAVRAHVG
ncbi:MAG: hypothetical protein WC558_02060 [Patulibacter sp.]